VIPLFLSFFLFISPQGRLHVDGTRWVAADGTAFHWRGISAFRLVEMVAHGQEKQADAYLAWAASKHLTIVRVITMADILFDLSPEDGVRALPRLLEMAQSHGLAVEVVALADTARIKVDPRAHVKAIGEICARYPNAVLEIANEPGHSTQIEETERASYLLELRKLVPSAVPVALGSVERGDDLAAGDYVTWHPPRGRNWLDRLSAGGDLQKRFGKPVVVDEPIGAGERMIRNRRSNDPAQFRRMAEICRNLGLGATFHYEGGLRTAIPTGREADCFKAWLEGLGGISNAFLIVSKKIAAILS
jgi:hypothetical protein